MDRYQAEVQELLEENEAVLVRSRKHRVYQLPDGKTYVEATSPSDWRAGRNNLRDLRRLLTAEPVGKQPATADAPATSPSPTIKGLLRPWPARSDAPVVIPPTPGASPVERSGIPVFAKAEQPKLRRLYWSEVQAALEAHEGLWSLTECERVMAIYDIGRAHKFPWDVTEVLYAAVPKWGNENDLLSNARYRTRPALVLNDTMLVPDLYLRYKARRKLVHLITAVTSPTLLKLTQNAAVVIVRVDALRRELRCQLTGGVSRKRSDCVRRVTREILASLRVLAESERE